MVWYGMVSVNYIAQCLEVSNVLNTLVSREKSQVFRPCLKDS